MCDVAPSVLRGVCASLEERPDRVLAVWDEIVGISVAKMTHAHNFQDGVLHVKVKNSTLYSLLSRRDRGRILVALRRRLPKVTIKDIAFRIG